MSTQEKIVAVVLGVPMAIAANWLFAWFASSFTMWQWFWPSADWWVFYGLAAQGTILPIVAAVVLLFKGGNRMEWWQALGMLIVAVLIAVLIIEWQGQPMEWWQYLLGILIA